MIATYIQELLATNNRVIVPNFGAFLVRATSKSKDANTLEEKLKDIYFSPFLKFNDELLEKYIIKKEDVSKEQAAEKIKDFIDLVKKELDQEKPFEIKDFGHFEADKQGKVQFITVAKEKKEEKETKATSKTAAESKTSSSKKTAPKEEEKKAAIGSDKPKEKEPVKTSTKKTEEAKKEPAKAEETKLEEFKEEKKEPVSEAAKKAKKTYKSPETKPIYSYKKEKKSINKGLVWAIAIGVPIAAIFVWALLNLNTVKKVFNKEKDKTEQKVQATAEKKKPTPTEGTEQDKKETAATSEAKKEAGTESAKPAEDKAQPSTKSTKKYYIIAGSFKNEKYAISYMNKLKKEGYNAEKLAERNGMHAVSYNSFTDKRKAIAEYKFLAQEKGLKTWILYY